MAETITDPDRGKAKGDPPTNAEKIEAMDLTVRAMKVKHLRDQSTLIEEANRLTRYPKAQQGVIAG